ncbi:hypothetical protein GN956_G4438 [Arapaima gigas]
MTCVGSCEKSGPPSLVWCRRGARDGEPGPRECAAPTGEARDAEDVGRAPLPRAPGGSAEGVLTRTSCCELAASLV